MSLFREKGDSEVMQRKRSPIPKPTIRHPDRKKEADRTACRGGIPLDVPEHMQWQIPILALCPFPAITPEMFQDILDTEAVREAMNDPETISWEQVEKELGL